MPNSDRYRRAFRQDSGPGDHQSPFGFGDLSEGAMRASQAVSAALESLSGSMREEVEAGYQVAERLMQRGPIGMAGGPRGYARSEAPFGEAFSGGPFEALGDGPMGAAQLGQRLLEAAIDALEAAMAVAGDYTQGMQSGRGFRGFRGSAEAGPPPGMSHAGGHPQWAQPERDTTGRHAGRVAPGSEFETAVELYVGEHEGAISGRCELTPFVGVSGTIEPHYADLNPQTVELGPGQSQEVTIRLAVPPGALQGRYSARLRIADGAFESDPLVVDIG